MRYHAPAKLLKAPALATAIFVHVLAWSGHVSAQPVQPKGAEAPPPGAPAEPEPKDPAAELVEQLMTSDPEETDMGWLFSHADEYAPSRLTGKPLPAPGLPERGEGSPRSWDPRWRKFGTFNYILTGAGFVTAGASSAITPVPSRWQERNRLDEWGRRTLGIDDYDSALWARDLSDVLVSVNMVYPMLIDSLIIMYWYRASDEVAAQMALITLEAVAINAAIQGLTSGTVSRERPYVRDCGGAINQNLDDCIERDRYRSFFSGHASNAFTAASVSCSHHMRHAVFGHPFADGLACGTAYATASTVALMRVVGQRHFISDVVTGAAVGTLTGLGVPWLFHYGPLARTDSSGPSASLSWSLMPMTNGLALGGTF